MSPTLLIVDDDEEIRTQLKWALNKDYEVILAGDRAEAIEKFTAKSPMVTMLDLGLPPRPNEPEEGLAALSEILAIDGSANVIIVSGQGEKENALRAVGAEAYDFFCKPVELEELKFMLRRRSQHAFKHVRLNATLQFAKFPLQFRHMETLRCRGGSR